MKVLFQVSEGDPILLIGVFSNEDAAEKGIVDYLSQYDMPSERAEDFRTIDVDLDKITMGEEIDF